MCMSDWQERITGDTAPSIRVEHDLRYHAAAPLILAGGPWADLGCGNGLAAASALGDARPPHAVLVDLEAEVTARAAAELGMPEATQIAGDLTDPATLERIGDALRGHGGDPVVTCFEVVEHLQSFIALVEWASALARDAAATFLISVPNDAFWAIDNPHHVTAWSEGAFEELLQLLPAERTVLRQVSLTGSVLLGPDPQPVQHALTVSAGGEGTVATHFLTAFGPRHAEVWLGALAAQSDQLQQRRWERQRESNVVLAQRMAQEHKLAVEERDRMIQEHWREFDDWRAYIHELERELGRPLSGAPGEDTPA